MNTAVLHYNFTATFDDGKGTFNTGIKAMDQNHAHYLAASMARKHNWRLADVRFNHYR